MRAIEPKSIIKKPLTLLLSRVEKRIAENESRLAEVRMYL